MREAVKTLSRLSAARTIIVTAVLLASAHGALAGQRGSTDRQTGSSGSDNVAYAVPRSTPLNGAETALAQPLAPSDVAIYRRIFADQDAGKLAAAQKLVGRLGSNLLIGQVQAQLYLGPHHHSNRAELEAWLKSYNGQPNTLRILHLLRKRLPRGAVVPAAHVTYLPEPALTKSGAAPPRPKSVPMPRYIADRVDNLVRSHHTERALSVIGGDNRISPEAGAALRGVVARDIFVHGDYRRAFTVASHATREGDGTVWRPDYIAGLAAWQTHDIAKSLPFFAAAATATHASAGQRAAGAFWAARVALRLRLPDAYLGWLKQAATAEGSFYGMLAGRLLGNELTGANLSASLSEADIDAVAAHRDGALAFALIQVGKPQAASRALRAMWPELQNDPALGRAVMGVAARAGLVDVAVALEQKLPGNSIAGIHLPLPGLHPLGGFNVDPSLVYALARTESGFDADAVSSVGARGLMQLMPLTAKAMARRGGISGDPRSPAINLALGQNYLTYLGQQPGVNNSLLDILASYNAGPVAAAAWAKSIHANGDPLIFLESIPNSATRRFVRQVLTDSWIYAEEIGGAPESLNAIAQGKFPLLAPYGATAIADR